MNGRGRVLNGRNIFVSDKRAVRVSAVLGGRQTVNAFEGFVEVALVGEPRGLRDLAERRIGLRDLTAGELGAQTAHVFANRAAEPFLEGARQVNRVHARNAGHLSERKGGGKIGVEK